MGDGRQIRVGVGGQLVDGARTQRHAGQGLVGVRDSGLELGLGLGLGLGGLGYLVAAVGGGDHLVEDVPEHEVPAGPW